MLIWALSVPASAEDLSVEGYSGHLHVPSAWVQPQGRATLLFTNARDPRFRSLGPARTYVAAVGLLPYLEGAARLTSVTGEIEDLSLNLKFRLPLDLLLPHAPFAVAFGTQDEGGAKPYFRSRYAVVSGEWSRLRGSLGYGTGPDRLRGLFGGVEVRALEGSSLPLSPEASLLADYDARELSVGARVALNPTVLSVPLRMTLLAKSSPLVAPTPIEVGAALAFPLGLSEGRPAMIADAPAVALTPGAGMELLQLRDDLVEVGFENVRVGEDGALVVVELENNVLPHSELDAVDVALGFLAHRAPARFGRFALVLLREGLPVVEYAGALAPLRHRYGVPGAPFAPMRGCCTTSFAPVAREGVRFVAPVANGTPLHLRLMLGPGLRHAVGTEYGSFDFELALRPEAELSLWKGAQLYARGNLPFAWSQNARLGGPLQELRSAPGVDHALLRQAVPLSHGLFATVSGGVFRSRWGGAAELLWVSPSGAHAVGAQGAVTHDDFDGAQGSATGSYRFYFADARVVAQVAAGQFYAGDRGARLSISRFFGDTLLTAFASRTQSTVIGVQLSLPLTPSTSMRPGYFQVQGARRWSTEVSTRVGGGANVLQTGTGVIPLAPWGLEARYLDAGRLTCAELERVSSREGFVNAVNPP